MSEWERTSVTQTVLEEDELIFNICHLENKSLMFSSFANITVSRLLLGEPVTKARYQQLCADVAHELHQTRVAWDAGWKGNPLNGSFVSHLLAFLKQGASLHLPYEAITSYVASVILMDAYPSTMHDSAHIFTEFCPRLVFRKLYWTAVYTALRQVYNMASFVNAQCQSVEDQLAALFDMMTTNKEPSSQIHRYNISKWKNYWRWVRLETMCFWCLWQS
ncbi:hypothetical protein EMCG_05063 [[Emmonsia] crescens]|uniref:Uncharacterized protein n=1 Tax=[Emmonsia] crescens TaxID=73230 RepID=A0A0G2J6L8_9EURO|nr:hypothetical protein EMCG_05063 [Emmonsia crescens UAMH 3008]